MYDAIASISPPQRLSLVYLKGRKRNLLTLFLAFDSRILNIYTNMNEVMIAQIRLAWWRDTISSNIKPKGEPLAAFVGEMEDVFPEGNIASILASMIDGWEHLIASDISMNDETMMSYANGRGGILFQNIAMLCGEYHDLESCGKLGKIWALSLLYTQYDERGKRARELAIQELEGLNIPLLSKKLRFLTILAYPAIRALKLDEGKMASDDLGLLYGLAYIWHAISGRWSFSIN